MHKSRVLFATGRHAGTYECTDPCIAGTHRTTGSHAGHLWPTSCGSTWCVQHPWRESAASPGAFAGAATGIRAYCRYPHCPSALPVFVRGAVGLRASPVGLPSEAHGDLAPHMLPGGVSYRTGSPTCRVGNSGVWP
jgi:hypothetical protein